MKKNFFGLQGIEENEEKDIMSQIYGCLQADIPVFLHGKPGCGKSQRVKEIDSDAITLELSLLPMEDLTGMKVVEEGKVMSVMPQWLRTLQEKCQAQPNENHILFLDEFTNAPESIQNLAYSLILDRRVNRLWKLPENARIIIAGNEVEDSLVATELLEPLKDRMAHINIEESFEDWMEWAKEHHIHEDILAYLTKHPKLRMKWEDHVLNMEREVTPRTWERASQMMNTTEDVECLRSILPSHIVDEMEQIDSKVLLRFNHDGIVFNGETYRFNDKASSLFQGIVNELSKLLESPPSFLTEEEVEEKRICMKKIYVCFRSFQENMYDFNEDTLISAFYSYCMPFEKENLKKLLLNERYQIVFEEDKEDSKDDYQYDSNEYLLACIDANIPVFLHGKPGEGKSSRVEQIDPDCQVLELSLAPIEELAGMVVYDQKELKKIKPTWLTQLEKKCSEYPEKNHILFLDELTNAMPMIQSLAYSLILDRKVANLWNLPQNVRIVAAGNSIEDSSVASEIPEPLKDRFAHVKVDTEIEPWIDWAIEANIHPAIICFLAENHQEAFKKRENGRIVTTPRTWERASKQLWTAPYLDSLEPIIGEELTDELREFCHEEILPKSQMKEALTEPDCRNEVVHPYAQILNLLDTKIEEVKEVRHSLSRTNPKTVSLFDKMWVSYPPEAEIRAEELYFLDLQEDNQLEKQEEKPSEYVLFDGIVERKIDKDFNPITPYYSECIHDYQDENWTEEPEKIAEEESVEDKWDNLIGKHGKKSIVRQNATIKSLRKTPGRYEKVKRKYDAMSR